jgi:hypothetical protein
MSPKLARQGRCPERRQLEAYVSLPLMGEAELRAVHHVHHLGRAFRGRE